jgi:hypothetical protein
VILPPVKLVTQFILSVPDEEVYGNCLQAAVASALGMELLAVPHFSAFGHWEAATRLFLREHGLDWRWTAGALIPEDRSIVIGRSPRNPEQKHALVAENGDIIWDPHPSHAGVSEIIGCFAFTSLPQWPARCVLCGAPEAV